MQSWRIRQLNCFCYRRTPLVMNGDQLPRSSLATSSNPTVTTISAPPSPMSKRMKRNLLKSWGYWIPVMTHASISTSSGTSSPFQQMFRDSEIAAKFSCGETKCAYHCRFGIIFSTYYVTKLRNAKNLQCFSNKSEYGQTYKTDGFSCRVLA